MHIRSRALIAALFAAAACQEQPSEVLMSPRFDAKGREPSVRCSGLPRRTTSLVVSPATAMLTVGGTVDLVVANQAGLPVPDCVLTWSTANAAVATVSATGLVTGVGAGEAVRVFATVATSPTLVGTAAVTVRAPVASVTLTPANATVRVGGVQQFVAMLRDSNGNVLAGRTVTWTSSNTAVATVDATGNASANAIGSVTITATSEGKSMTAMLNVLLSPALSSELVAYYPFNGNADDATGHGWNGVPYRVTPTTDRFGKTNSSFSFNGTDSEIGVWGFDFAPTTSRDVTVSVWINSPGNGDPSGGWIVSRYYNLDAGRSNFAFGVGNSIGIGYDDYKFVNNLSTWAHLVAVFRGTEGTVTIYRNGVLLAEGSIAYNSQISADTPLMFGRVYGPLEGYFLGAIDDARLYNGALSAADVLALYNFEK